MSLKFRILLLTILPLLLMAGVIAVAWQMSEGLTESQSGLFRERLLEARQNELRRLLDLARSAIDPILKEAALHPEADPTPAQAEAKRILTALRFEGNGYFYLYDPNGVNLAHPIKPELVGKRLLNHRASRGCYLIRELLGVAAHGGGRTFEDQDRLGCYVLAALNQGDPGGGFLRYRWDNPSTGREEEKLGEVELLPVWGWMLGTGLYYDNINQDVGLVLHRVRANIGHTFTLILIILALTTLVAALLVLLTNLYQGRLASRHLQSLIRHRGRLLLRVRDRHGTGRTRPADAAGAAAPVGTVRAQAASPPGAPGGGLPSGPAPDPAPLVPLDAVVIVAGRHAADVPPDPAWPCPLGIPDRVFPLDLAENLVGRRIEGQHPNAEAEVRDLGVSARHLKLLRMPDGAFPRPGAGVVQRDRTQRGPLIPGAPTPLGAGDELTLELWTRIRLAARRGLS